MLCCAQWTFAEPTLDHELVAPCPLLSIMSAVRGCVVLEPTLRYSSIRNDDHGRQEESFVQGFLHSKKLSHGGNLHKNSSNKKIPSALLNLLCALPFRIAEGVRRPGSAEVVFTTLSANTTMVKCCDINFACDEAGLAWQGMAKWLANVPDHFNQMVRRHDLAALVVFAYWAAMLVNRAEHVGCWFLKGLAKIMVLQSETTFRKW